MAVFKTGAIVTDIVGSVGGTTFKRNGTQKVMMNKNFGGSYNKQLLNPRLQQIKTIFQAWRFLTLEQKNAWNQASTTFTFPDKFGTLRSISGRALFTKLNINNVYFGLIQKDPTGITSVIPSYTLEPLSIVISNMMATWVVNFGSGQVNFLVSFECSVLPLNAPVFNSRKTEYYDKVLFTKNIWITDAFFEKYYNPKVNSYVRLYLTVQNVWGFKAPPIVIETRIKP